MHGLIAIDCAEMFALWLVPYLHVKRVNAEIVQREMTAWWNLVQLEGAAGNLVEFFDLIDGVTA